MTDDDLITWLRAQLDDDERLARKAVGLNPKRWHLVGSTIQARSASGSESLVTPTVWPQDGEHIVRHDPARVLAEVDAMRRVLDAHTTAASAEDSEYDGGFTAGLLTALRFLALRYADRPGYRPEWRPSMNEAPS